MCAVDVCLSQAIERYRSRSEGVDLDIDDAGLPSRLPSPRGDQAETLAAIKNVFASGVGHCFAVVQPPGTGKTWCARVLFCADAGALRFLFWRCPTHSL